MAVPPQFAGHIYPYPFSSSSPSPVQHTLEFYLDYTCPFSARLFSTLHSTVIPLLHQKYPDSLRLIFRHHPQPWHPSSTLTHEAGLAVLRLAPARFWSFSAALFAHQREFFDEKCVDEGRNTTYGRLGRLARKSVDVDEGEVVGLLRVKSAEERGEGNWNAGNGVTDDLKRVIKQGRLVGVHVSPTVFFNGIEERGISSSWGREEWEPWLERNVK